MGSFLTCLASDHPRSVTFKDLGDAEVAHGIIKAQFVVETKHHQEYVMNLMNASRKLGEKLAAYPSGPRWAYRISTLLSQGYHDLEVLMGRPSTKMFHDDRKTLTSDGITFRDAQHEQDDLDTQPAGWPYSFQESTVPGIEKPVDKKHDRKSSRHKRQILGVMNTVLETTQILLEKKQMEALDKKVDFVINATEAVTNASKALANSLKFITESIKDLKAETAAQDLAAMGNMMLDIAYRHQSILQRQRDGVENLRKGILTPQAIPVEMMERALLKVQTLARRKDPKLIFPGRSVLDAYALRSQILEINGTLRVAVDIPLTKVGEDKTHMLQFIPGPIWKDYPRNPVWPDPESSILLTNGFTAATLTDDLMQKYCVKLGGRKICETTVKYNNLEDTCLGALYRGQVGRALRLCPLKQAPSEPMVMPMGANTFLLTSITNVSVTISCKTEEDRLKPSTNKTSVVGSKVIKIENGCHLVSDKLYVEPEKVQSLYVTEIFMPDLQDLGVTSWDYKEDTKVLRKVAMAASDVAEALRLDDKAQDILDRAKRANISEDYSFLLGVVNDTLIAPIVTSAESGLTFAENILGTASTMSDILTHPIGIMAFGAAILGLFLLVGLVILALKAGLWSTKDKGDNCARRCRVLQQEMELESERVLKMAQDYAKKASYEAYKMMKSQCNCGGQDMQALQ